MSRELFRTGVLLYGQGASKDVGGIAPTPAAVTRALIQYKDVLSV